MKNIVAILAVAGLASTALAVPEKVFTFTGNVSIPDNTTTFTAINLVVPADPDGANTITDLNVDFIMRHTWQGDVVVRLRGPDGTEVRLTDRPGRADGATTGFGFSTDNYGNPTTGVPFFWDDEAAAAYDTPVVAVNNPVGNWRPDGADLLSAFDGRSKVGTWTLLVGDRAGGDTGAVLQWSLHFTQIPTPGAAALIGLAGLAGLRRRR